jgi:hypothetical protein
VVDYKSFKKWHCIGLLNLNYLIVTPLSHNHPEKQHKTDKSTLSIMQKLNRILEIDQKKTDDNATPEFSNNETMIPKVIVRPNPFFTSITLDVTCSQGKHVIVRMFDEDEKIVKMFSWFLVKGINITNIGEVSLLPMGSYSLDIVDLEGDVLYSTLISKG